jgi:ferric-dicitrate binding protein FerR (iron transport regulator)
MEITNGLIQKFFENKCDPEEFEAVIHYLEQHPAEKASWLGREEWNAPIISLGLGNEEEKAVALRQLKENLFRESLVSVPVRRTLFRRLAIPAAAAVLLLVIGGIWMTARRTKDDSITAGPVSHRSVPGRLAWHDRTNATGKSQTMTMPDGSGVRLFAHSSLRYSDSFGISRRDIWLDGSADFSVKKDKVHPFTVTSGALATTALGTSFGIKSNRKAGNIVVRLYTGRAVVRSVQPLPGWKEDIYLAPGQQVLYDDRQLLATVTRFRAGPSAPDEQWTSPAFAPEQTDLVFNNASLKEVLNQLSIQYHTKIAYRASDLAGMNFTGSVSRSDSLATFLKLLATMNNLDVREDEPGFIIARHLDQ